MRATYKASHKAHGVSLGPAPHVVMVILSATIKGIGTVSGVLFPPKAQCAIVPLEGYWQVQ